MPLDWAKRHLDASAPLLLAVLQVSGGVLGLWFALAQLMHAVGAEVTAIVVFFILYYAFCGIAGVALLKWRVVGLWMTVFVQVVQLLHITIGRIAVSVLVGPHVLIGVSSTMLGMDIGISSGFSVVLAEERLPCGIAINAVAAIAIWYCVVSIRRHAKVSASEHRGAMSLS